MISVLTCLKIIGDFFHKTVVLSAPSLLLSRGDMYQRLQGWVFDAKSMLALAEVAVAAAAVFRGVELEQPAVVGILRHETVRLLVQ